MNFGLSETDLQYIVEGIQHFPEIKQAAIFGSRAKGNYRRGSDVDIAIWGARVNFDTVARLHALLEEESPMPYFFDIIDFSHLDHPELREHIERVGKVIFKRDNQGETSVG